MTAWIWLLCPIPAAHAQLSGRLSVDSQYRDRGYAIAQEKPVVTAGLSYDHRSGLYANTVVIASARDSQVGLAGYQAGVGYAARVGQSVSIDVGAARTGYAAEPGKVFNQSYTEIYTGLTVRNITARAYYSPDYFARRRTTLYTQLEANFRLRPQWNLNLHLGALRHLADRPRYTDKVRYDWRASVSRALGAFEVYASVSGRSAGGDYHARSRGRSVATFGAAVSF